MFLVSAFHERNSESALVTCASPLKWSQRLKDYIDRLEILLQSHSVIAAIFHAATPVDAEAERSTPSMRALCRSTDLVSREVLLVLYLYSSTKFAAIDCRHSSCTRRSASESEGRAVHDLSKS